MTQSPAFTFVKAKRTQRKLKMALAGLENSGKTFTALLIAEALKGGGRIALIDTENASASLYADRFDFDALTLTSFSPETYKAAIDAAVATGDYTVIIVDSLSHAWQGRDGVLQQVERVQGNKFTEGWGRRGTPLQNLLLDAVFGCPLHLIATLRVKQEYAIENVAGKATPKKIGMAPIQREGIAYEFDIMGTLDHDHTLRIDKSRMSSLAEEIARPGPELGQQILAWLSEGEPAPPPQPSAPSEPLPTTGDDERQAVIGIISRFRAQYPHFTDQVRAQLTNTYGTTSLNRLSQSQLDDVAAFCAELAESAAPDGARTGAAQEALL